MIGPRNPSESYWKAIDALVVVVIALYAALIVGTLVAFGAIV